MSCNRENITWQSADQKWNIGFYTYYNIGDNSDEDFDYEWDVEYEDDSFWWVSTGHATPRDAYRAYCLDNANPGTTTVLQYKGNSALVKKLDKMVWAYRNPALAEMELEKARKALARARRKTLNEEIASNPYFTKVGNRVSVTFKKDLSTILGQSNTVTGNMRMSDIWLTVEGEKFFNTTTRKLAPTVFSFKVPPISRRW